MDKKSNKFDKEMNESSYSAIEKAFITLGLLGGNTSGSKYREAWLALYKFVEEHNEKT